MTKKIKILTLIILLLTLSNLSFGQIINKEENNTQIISEWLNLRKLKLSDFKSKDVIKFKNIKYEKLDSLTRIYSKNKASEYYHFNTKGNCVMIYIGDENKFNDISLNDIINKYGKPQEIVRSRVGKRAHHYIYSKNGFAFSELDNKIRLFEIFPDCSLQEYKETIYIEPLLFIR